MEVPPGELPDTLAHSEPNPEELLEARTLQKAVQEALHCLPAPCRATLVLFYLQGMKYREIAEALGVPIGTVKSRLHDGLRRMKVKLEKVF